MLNLTAVLPKKAVKAKINFWENGNSNLSAENFIERSPRSLQN